MIIFTLPETNSLPLEIAHIPKLQISSSKHCFFNGKLAASFKEGIFFFRFHHWLWVCTSVRNVEYNLWSFRWPKKCWKLHINLLPRWLLFFDPQTPHVFRLVQWYRTSVLSSHSVPYNDDKNGSVVGVDVGLRSLVLRGKPQASIVSLVWNPSFFYLLVVLRISFPLMQITTSPGNVEIGTGVVQYEKRSSPFPKGSYLSHYSASQVDCFWAIHQSFLVLENIQ